MDNNKNNNNPNHMSLNKTLEEKGLKPDDEAKSELGADMYDYGVGGPGGRDDSDAGRGIDPNNEERRTMKSNTDTGAGVGSDE